MSMSNILPRIIGFLFLNFQTERNYCTRRNNHPYFRRSRKRDEIYNGCVCVCVCEWYKKRKKIKRGRSVNTTGRARWCMGHGVGCAEQIHSHSSSRHEMALGKSCPRNGGLDFLDCRIFHLSSCHGDDANAECVSLGK